MTIWLGGWNLRIYCTYWQNLRVTTIWNHWKEEKWNNCSRSWGVHRRFSSYCIDLGRVTCIRRWFWVGQFYKKCPALFAELFYAATSFCYFHLDWFRYLVFLVKFLTLIGFCLSKDWKLMLRSRYSRALILIVRVFLTLESIGFFESIFVVVLSLILSREDNGPHFCTEGIVPKSRQNLVHSSSWRNEMYCMRRSWKGGKGNIIVDSFSLAHWKSNVQANLLSFKFGYLEHFRPRCHLVQRILNDRINLQFPI